MDGRIESPIKFISYKIQNVKFEIPQNTGALRFSLGNGVEPSLKLGIAQPIYFENAKQYVSTVNAIIKIEINETESINFEAYVTGLFEVDERPPHELEDKIAKIQLPTILMPYLRGFITSFFANAGLGPFIFPLINMQNLAKVQLKDTPIQIQ